MTNAKGFLEAMKDFKLSRIEGTDEDGFKFTAYKIGEKILRVDYKLKIEIDDEGNVYEK